MYSIADIQRLIDNKELVIQPKYQRRRTGWPNTAKTSLIDTILNNYPIQPIYLREYVTKNKTRIKEVIDGQQRISTILEFIRDEFALTKNLSDSNLHDYKFSETPFDTQQEILDYELSFISIKGATESDIISIFSRLNSFTLPLNSQEKRNAVWAGQFKTLVYKISSIYSSFWSDFGIFTDKAIARMKEAQFISEILTTLEIGYEKYSAKKVEETYKKYDQKFTNSDNYFSSINFIMSVIGNLMESPLLKSHFSKNSWFFTLFLCIYEKVFFAPGSEKKDFTANKIDIEKYRTNLIKLVTDYSSGNISDDIVLLYRQGTASSSNRKARHKHLISFLK